MNYLLKSSLIIAFFYLFYLIFLQRETFFNTIRAFFIIGILASVFLPKIQIPVYVEHNIIQDIDANMAFAETNTTIQKTPILSQGVNDEYDWFLVLKYVYFVGFSFVLLKIGIAVFSLLRVIYYGKKRKSKQYIFIEVNQDSSPFSVFNYIVYNKKMFSKNELDKILFHEKVHVNQKHTYDLLLVNILTVILWFNPFIWFYKKRLQENLEFIADKKVVNQYNKKEYQYLLLKAGISKYPFALSNNFYQSLIKKRIIMLQKSNSKKVNQLKYVLIIPFMALFLISFNTKEILIQSSQKDVNFINPVDKGNVTGILSYGYRTNPMTKEPEFHKGIDIQAYADMDVYATSDGIITKTGLDKDKGGFIEIQHAHNFITKYQHLNLVEVRKGDSVKSGDIIGTIGNLGKSISSYLHYEILKNGKNINPISFVYYAFKKEFKITSKTSDDELKKIEKEFSDKKSPAIIKFDNVRRNENNEIIYLNFLTKFPGDDRFYNRFSHNSGKLLEKMIFSFIENGKVITLKNDKNIIEISKEFVRIEVNNTKEFNGYNTVIMAKHTDEQLQEIAEDFRKKNKISFDIVFVKRNKNKEIIGLELKAKTKKHTTKFNYNSSSEPIPAIILAYDIDSDIVAFPKLKEKKNINKTKSGIIYYLNKTYFYFVKNGVYTFYNNYGEEVDSKLAKILKESIKHYRVKAGDTFYSIAKKHQMSVEKLKSLNPKISTLVKGVYLKVE